MIVQEHTAIEQARISRPVVSVVMAVRNERHYLKKSIESILAQTYSDFEFIILDDGSTDCSLNIINNFAAEDSRIRVVARHHRGLTATLNEGLSLSRGSLIARMDADDISLPSRLERQVRFLAVNPEVIAVGCRAIVIDGFGFKVDRWMVPTQHDDIDRQHLEGYGGGIIHPTALIRQESLRSVGGYNEEYEFAQDYDLWLRLAETGELANLPDFLFHYRSHRKARTIEGYHAQLEAGQAIQIAALLRRGVESGRGVPGIRPIDTSPHPMEIRRRLWVNTAWKNGFLAGYLVHLVMLQIEKASRCLVRVMGSVLRREG